MKAAICAILAFASGVSAHADPLNLLNNPGFESGNLSGWTVGGSVYGVAAAGTPLGDFPPFGSAAAIAHSGNYSAYYVGNSGTTFTLTQSLTLAAGTYDFGVYLAANNSGSQTGFFAANTTILIDGALASTNPFTRISNGDYLELFGNAVLGAGLHSFEFSFQNGGSASNAFLIDDAFVMTPTVPVPEPGTMGLLGIGIAAVALSRLRRRRDGRAR